MGASVVQMPLKKLHIRPAWVRCGEIANDDLSALGDRHPKFLEHVHKHLVVEVVKKTGGPDQVVLLFRLKPQGISDVERGFVEKTLAQRLCVIDRVLILLDAVEMHLRIRVVLEELEHVPTRAAGKVQHLHLRCIQRVALFLFQ